MLNKDLIIRTFNLKYFGSKGWMRGDLSCPDCGRSDKFGILFSNKGGVAHCFYCQQPISLYKLLFKIGRQDLIDGEFDFVGDFNLPDLHDNFSDDDIIKEVQKPLGYYSLNYDNYLNSRGFIEEQYKQFYVGRSDLHPALTNKIVFLIYQRGILRGWMARSCKSKAWHKDNLRRSKEGLEDLVLRYRNSEDDFSKMLGGLDEITDNTHTLILVEGLFDKANIDRLLNLNNQEEIKCCFTFGDNIGDDQINLIPGSVKNIILMYDEGTVNNIKLAGVRMLSKFLVSAILLRDKNKDPGDLNYNELQYLINNSMYDFLSFYRNILPFN